MQRGRNTIYIAIFRIKNSDIGWSCGTGETTLCSKSNLAHHPKMSQARVPAEIQSPRRKNVIIAYDSLRELAGFKDYQSFASAHRKWVQDALEKTDSKRDGRWTESIAVGSNYFIERIKTAMGAMARGRTVRSINGGFELRETQSSYNAIFDPENHDIAPKKG